MLVLVLALLRWPPFVTIFLGALAGGVLAVVTAPERVTAFAGTDLPAGLALLKGVWAALATGYVSATGEAAVDQLLTRGGMESMLGTVWLILVALAFGGIVEKAGVLDRLIGPVIAAARSVGALVAALVGAAFATNVLASDQYIAVVLPGRMFRGAFAGARACSGGPLPRARQLWHGDLAAHSLEQLRRLHGRNPRRRRDLLRPLRLLQPPEPAGLDRIRLPRLPDAADRGGGHSTRLAGRPTNPEAKEPPMSPAGSTRCLTASALLALAAGAPAVAQQVSAADIDRMMAVIEAQQAQIDAMRAELNALKAERTAAAPAPVAAASAPSPTPVAAAAPAAALGDVDERREAQMVEEGFTWRDQSGRSLTLSGQVNPAFNVVDDGISTDVFIVDNDTSNTRFRLDVDAPLGETSLGAHHRGGRQPQQLEQRLAARAGGGRRL